jgi:hypothetical protein
LRSLEAGGDGSQKAGREKARWGTPRECESHDPPERRCQYITDGLRFGRLNESH